MLAGSIVLIAPQNITGRFQFTFARIFRWPLSFGRNVSLSARARQPRPDVVTRREYDRLQNLADDLSEALSEQQRRFKQLYGVYNRYVWEGADFVLADVIRGPAGGPSREFIINYGKDNGLAKGQFVLGDNSIVGTISQVLAGEARVKLITDSTSSIAVKIGRFRAVMKGAGAGSGRIELARHKVQIGASVYAVKMAGLLDSALKVGTVSKCESSDEHPLLWNITVEPACELETLSEVKVIVMKANK
jgi:cell shape-determining protein MreC